MPNAEAPRPAAALQRSLSAFARLQTQSDATRPVVQPGRVGPQKYPSVSPNDVEMQVVAALALQHSPGASSLSTPQSSQLSGGSSPWSCTTRSSTPTSILEPPVTEKKHRTPSFTVYDAQPQNFKNPLFGTKASPSPQLAAYKSNHAPAPDRIDLGSPAYDADTARDHVPGQNNMATPVANLSRDINAVAGCEVTLCKVVTDQTECQ